MLEACLIVLFRPIALSIEQQVLEDFDCLEVLDQGLDMFFGPFMPGYPHDLLDLLHLDLVAFSLALSVVFLNLFSVTVTLFLLALPRSRG